VVQIHSPRPFSLLESLSYAANSALVFVKFLYTRRSFFKSSRCDESLSSGFIGLRCEIHFIASPFLGKLGTRWRFWKKNQNPKSYGLPTSSHCLRCLSRYEYLKLHFRDGDNRPGMWRSNGHFYMPFSLTV